MDLHQLQTSLGEAYLLERELGPGGMARVFLATEVALGRKVVIKVLPPETSSVVLSERFRREISLAAQLRHPHIIPLFAAGNADGLLYYTMPFVEGETLRARLARGTPIPVTEGVRLLREMAYALSYAHSHGVVHRDIKPENVLIENGHAVVADFGVAKALASATGSGERGIESITLTGMTMGSPTYMAPEQAAADPATDHRADLYALGVVAFEVFTGTPPFVGTPRDVVRAHMVDQPDPVHVRRPGLVRPISDLIARLLAKDPDDRPQSAGDVVKALDEIAAAAGLSNPEVERSVVSASAAARPGRTLMESRVLQVAVVLIIVAAGLGVYKTFDGPRAGGAVAPPSRAESRSVAVLPFVNTSGDVQNEHFSNGLTDELISTLGRVHGLKVAARTSVFALNGKGLDARAIGDTLGVATVLEGSARRDGTRLRVAAQLISAADGSVLWSQTFDREMLDVFAVQDEIAQAIVGALNVRLTEDERARLAGIPTKDLEAFDLYLKGRFGWHSRSREGVETALAFFQSAIDRDPRFALPYVGMAEAYVVMSNYGFMPVPEALAKARIAADKALSLDSAIADAHSSKGFVLASSGSYVEAEAAFRRAIQLNPSLPTAHHFYSLLLMMLGRVDEATAQNRLALSLDPLSVPANANRGVLLLQQGKHAEARPELEKALPLSGDNALAPYYLGALEASAGRYREALPLLQRAYRAAPGFPGVQGALAFIYARTGRRAQADSILAQIRASSRPDHRTLIQLALAEAMNGDVERAYALLGRPARWDVPTLIAMRADPLLGAFRADSRYPRLLSALGLRP